jgi:hypothetical protein
MTTLAKLPNDIPAVNPTTFRIRWVARIWSLLLLAIALILVGRNIFAPAPEATQFAEGDNLIPVSLLISVLGLLIAWRWEGLGAAINLGFFFANYLINWIYHHDILNFGLVFALSPVILPGILFLVAWLRVRKERGGIRIHSTNLREFTGIY